MVYKFARLNISRAVHPSVCAALAFRACLVTLLGLGSKIASQAMAGTHLEMPLFASLTCFVGRYARHGFHRVVGLPIVAEECVVVVVSSKITGMKRSYMS